MTCPSTAGWLNILAVSLNALGVLTLFYFRDLAIGGFVSRDSWQATVAQNLSRVRKHHVRGLSSLGFERKGGSFRFTLSISPSASCEQTQKRTLRPKTTPVQPAVPCRAVTV